MLAAVYVCAGCWLGARVRRDVLVGSVWVLAGCACVWAALLVAFVRDANWLRHASADVVLVACEKRAGDAGGRAAGALLGARVCTAESKTDITLYVFRYNESSRMRIRKRIAFVQYIQKIPEALRRA